MLKISFIICHLLFLLWQLQRWTANSSSSRDPNPKFLLCFWYGNWFSAPVWESEYYSIDYHVVGWFHELIILFVKVDGLIRLMQGENTGPINIGNPGSLLNYMIIRDKPLITWYALGSECNFLFFPSLPTVIDIARDTGEFTMMELAENVKEVCSVPNSFITLLW